LTEAGADTNLQNKNGETAFDLAQYAKSEIDRDMSDKKKLAKKGYNLNKIGAIRESLDSIMRILHH
jgi:hypothetical protein